MNREAGNGREGKKIDWMITLVPLGVIVVLCILFFFMPEQSNQVLSQVQIGRASCRERVWTWV